MTKPLQQGDLEPQVVATREEMLSAWKSLTVADKKALAIWAERLARAYQFADPGMTGEDLMQDAAVLIVKGTRTWEMKKVSFREFVFGVLRSLAGDLKRTNAGRVRAASLNADELLENVRDDRDPLAILEEQRHEKAVQAHLSALQVEFEDDETVFFVLESMREGRQPQEIRQQLNLDEKQFDAARKKIVRRSQKLWRAH
jgi:PHD/YefM family antitoxin component YafN of YafNO toxin-antitoxin module